MCDKDSYFTALYMMTGSASLVTSGLFVLLAMGNIHKREKLREKNEITKRNNESVLPTNISKVVIPPRLDLKYL